MKIQKIEFSPIGTIFAKSDIIKKKYTIPAQGYMDNIQYILKLNTGQNFEQALSDLKGFSHIWVIFYFDRSTNWKAKVVPPRGPANKRGIFATRSPYRPNGIGMTAVKLLNIHGLDLNISGGDFLDNTPVLDIKPYIADSDAIVESTDGWVAELSKHKWSVEWTKKSILDLENLKNPDCFPLKNYVERVLSYNRDPHPYRRIRKINPEKGVLAVQHFRIHFHLIKERKKVIVEEIGYMDT